MEKTVKRATMARLQSVARLSRTALAARLLDLGLYAGQDQVMLVLDGRGGRTPSQLAAELGVRAPTITKTLNRLAAQGFVEKRVCQSDGRQANVFLTESGRRAIRAIVKSVRKTEKQALKGLDKKDRKQFVKLLARVEANLASAAPPQPREEAPRCEQ